MKTYFGTILTSFLKKTLSSLSTSLLSQNPNPLKPIKMPFLNATHLKLTSVKKPYFNLG